MVDGSEQWGWMWSDSYLGHSRCRIEIAISDPMVLGHKDYWQSEDGAPVVAKQSRNIRQAKAEMARNLSGHRHQIGMLPEDCHDRAQPLW